MKQFFLCLSLIGAVGLHAQNIGAYSDYQNKFYVFDEGKTRQLEFQPVLSYDIGDKCLGYITNGGHLKAYSNHIDYELGSLIKSYTVTDNLICYQIGTQLYVFEDGKKTMLSKFVGNYLASDSLVAFFDTEYYFFKVYYKGEVIILEDGLLYENTRFFKVGRNMLAYIDAFGNFKVFYQGNVTQLEQTNLITGDIGRNILAYIDPITSVLKVFYNNEVLEIEPFKPVNFQLGFEKVAYVTSVGDFKLFDNGETYTISSFAPEFYELKDEMLVYYQQNQLFAFYKGEQYLIENYIPSSYQVNQNTIAYIDQNGYLKLFSDGKQQVLSYQIVSQYKVLRNLVIFNEGMNTTKIYYDGKVVTP